MTFDEWFDKYMDATGPLYSKKELRMAWDASIDSTVSVSYKDSKLFFLGYFDGLDDALKACEAVKADCKYNAWVETSWDGAVECIEAIEKLKSGGKP